MKIRIFMAMVSLLILFPSLGMAQGGWITLPAQAFNPGLSAYTWEHHIGWGSESYLFFTGVGSSIFIAPVIFPQEADGLSIRQMNATIGDFDASNFISVYLLRMNRYSGVSHEVFYAFTSPASEIPGKTVLTDTTGGYRLIDSQKYAWFILFYFSGAPSTPQNLRLYSVRIQYQ